MNNKREQMLEIIRFGTAQEIILNAQSTTFRNLFTESAIVQMKVIYANIMLDDDTSYSVDARLTDARYQIAEYARAMIQYV